MDNFYERDTEVLKRIIEEAPAPIALYQGSEAKIRLANDAMLKAWGKEKSIIGLPLEQAVPELLGQPFVDRIKGVYKQGLAYKGSEDLAVLRVGGRLQTFYYNYTFQPWFNNEGEVWGVLHSATDVTDIVLAKKDVADIQGRTQFILNSAGIGTWDLDLKSNQVWLDKRAREFFGNPQDAVFPFNTIFEFIYHEDREKVEKAIEEALTYESGGNYDMVYRTVGATDKKLRWVHCRGKGYFDEVGNAYRFSGTALNITEQKEALEKAAEAERMAKLATDGAGVGTFVIDLPTGKITYSPLLVKITTGTNQFNLSRDQFVQYLHPEDNEKRMKAFKLAQETGKVSYETRFIWQDGSVHWVKITGAYHYDQGGIPVQLSGTVQDITSDIHLKDEQHKLLLLAENSSEYMGIADSSGKMVYLNKYGREMIGIDLNVEISHLNASDFFRPEHFEKVKTEILPLLAEQGKWSGTIHLRNFKTGEIIPCHANYVILFDAAGNATNRGVTIRDLRQELKAQTALVESEKRFRNMVQQAPVAIAVLSGTDLVIDTANAAILNLLDRPASVVGKTLLEALPEMENQPFPDLLRKVYQTGEYHNGIETPAVILTKGKPVKRYFNFVFAPFRESDGTIRSVIVIMTEVSEQVKAKHGLEQSESRFRSIVIEAPVAKALYTGPEFIVDIANEAMLKLWDKDESIVGKRLEDAFPEFRTQSFLKIIKQVYNSGIAYHADQQKVDLMVKGKLQTFWFNITFKPLHDADGNIYAIINTTVDVSNQVTLQKQKDEFLGIASHELKTPVTSIKAYTQVLETMLRNHGEEDKAAMVRKMDLQINRLTNLIGDLLDVTKINSGKIRFNRNFFDFTEMVKEVVEEVQRTSEHHTIREKLQPVGQVYGDRERIGQVIINLITNAIKYSPDSDDIIVSVEKTEQHVNLCVQDFGIGISPDKQTRVFEQFYRVSGEKQHTFPGLGLGLYISSQIIKRERGKIWVTSQVGKGSTFCFSLPLNRESPSIGD